MQLSTEMTRLQPGCDPTERTAATYPLVSAAL